MSPNPWDSGSCPSLVTALKGDLQPFFFFNLAKERCLALSAPVLEGLGRSSRPSPGAGAGTSALAIFTRRDRERVTFPEGRCHSRGDSRQRPSRGAHHPERLFPGCGGSQRRGFWRGCLWRDREGELSLQKGAACLAPEASSWLSLCLAETGRAQSGSCCEFPGHE